MELKKLILAFTILLTSCNNGNSIVKNIENKTLNLTRKSQYDLINIENDNSRQCIILDSNHRIDQIQNIISVEGDTSYVNTWIGFDLQGNFDPSKSYYFETFLVNNNDTTFVECSLPNLIFNNSRCYVLIGKYDNVFRAKSTIDTLLFDSDYLVRIPIKEYKIGKNNMKFIIVEEELVNNRLKIKKTYVNKDFMTVRR